MVESQPTTDSITQPHSPLPWVYHGRLSASENHKGFRFGSPAEGFPVGEVFPLDEDGIKGEENARLIVLAVNFHDRLVAALRAILDDAVGEYADENCGHCQRLAAARALLAELESAER